MRIDRRNLLKRMPLALVAAATLGLAPSLSQALSKDEAITHVEAAISEIFALVDSSSSGTTKAARLHEIMERRAAMPQIARFAAGLAWRDMSDDQQTRFVSAFSKFISGVYASRFQEYAGGGNSAETFRMGKVIDVGRKGMLVKTSIVRSGTVPVQVEWLVTDRPGRVVIADIVIEGVSMLVTERAAIGGRLDAHHGDVDLLIADLNS